MSDNKVTRIIVGGHPTGIIGLQPILEEVAKEFTGQTDDEIKAELLKRLSEKNYTSSKTKGAAFVKKYKSVIRLIGIVSLFLFSGLISGNVQADEFKNLPVKGMVTMIDLGAKKCIPCKMMAPIMEKMERKYEGKAAVVFIDVWEHREQAARFRIRAIPTQIFFDADSKEVYRHVGFMPEKAIVAQLENMGVK